MTQKEYIRELNSSVEKLRVKPMTAQEDIRKQNLKIKESFVNFKLIKALKKQK